MTRNVIFFVFFGGQLFMDLTKGIIGILHSVSLVTTTSAYQVP